MLYTTILVLNSIKNYWSDKVPSLSMVFCWFFIGSCYTFFGGGDAEIGKTIAERMTGASKDASLRYLFLLMISRAIDLACFLTLYITLSGSLEEGYATIDCSCIIR